MSNPTAARELLVVPIGRPTFDLELGASLVGAASTVLESLGADPLGERPFVNDLAELDQLIDGLDLTPSIVVVLPTTFSDS